PAPGERVDEVRAETHREPIAGALVDVGPDGLLPEARILDDPCVLFRETGEVVVRVLAPPPGIHRALVGQIMLACELLLVVEHRAPAAADLARPRGVA